ncbi:AarF/UbiB family protein [Agromyces sp. H3Y2-19a]|uniref:ABC1 kinase family protein n=1 Tax=Agromyces chromiiresistens TaxID=3030835 RepID=UPI0023B91338|nr:AarF/UbiB family protein [Agromyces chromiiresistens]MDF0514249.1 AarF/UbiB family protein [Agromyces chromiiresistens]
MNVGDVLLNVALMVALTLLFLAVLTAFVRRVLGVRVGIVRIVIAGFVGLAAEVGFESQVVWGKQDYSAALLPVQLGIVMFAAVAFLVIAEIIVPPGSIQRPDQWLPSLRRSAARTRRYTEISRIAVRHGLVPFRPNAEPTAAGHAERTRQAIALRAALEDAGGAFVKLGQVLSTRSDVLPPEFVAELSRLQQRVPPAEWAEVRALLEAELPRPMGDVFGAFDETPLAAASIGQVHRATLASGEPVAVKVQRPGIVPLVDRDLDIVLRLADQLDRSTEWGRSLGVRGLAEAFAANLREELDYRIEAANMAAMRATLATHPARERVSVPRHHAELSGERVLVMDLVEGRTLSDPAALQGRSGDERAELADRLFSSAMTQIIDDGVFHADLHPGNIVIVDSGEIVLLDFGSIGRLDSELRRQIGEVLLAFYRGDARSFGDALIGLVELPDDLDEVALRRRIGAFMSRRLGPGGTVDATVVTEMVRLLAENRIAVPGDLAAAFRAIGTLEGTLRLVKPGFDLLTEAEGFAKTRVAEATRPSALFSTAVDEIGGLLPMLRRMPRRADRISAALADGRLSFNVRLFADRRDRSLVRDLVNLVAVAFLAGVFGIMAAMLLVSEGGPAVAPDFTLYQLFGYLLVIVSGLLTLKVLFDVFRRRTP